ncbi:MAG: alpha/beta hydrolase [Betaproteobacteria bacterium]
MLLALTRIRGRPNQLTVYIEGDGAAWITPYHPPSDPTPRQPTALAMAASDPSDAVIYLGRPCQYLDDIHLAECSVPWWTHQRFAPEVLRAYEQGLNSLKAESGAQTFRLVGYSGGGVIAALLALRRNDVDALITVASPLATGEWIRSKGLSPLSGSIDPLSEPGVLPPAIFWTGSRDEVVPISSVELFSRHKGGEIRQISDYDHQCCWAHDWPRLLKESP